MLYATRMLYNDAIRIYFIRAARATRPVAVARSLKNRRGGRKLKFDKLITLEPAEWRSVGTLRALLSLS